VLLETLYAGIKHQATYIVLITGDCLATDPEDIKAVVEQMQKEKKPAARFPVKGGEVRGCTINDLLYTAEYMQAVHEHGLQVYFPKDAAEPTPNLSVDTEEDRQQALRIFRRVPAANATADDMRAALKSEEPVIYA
jgi:spore coat polysaccharide biosynthesis protein SpsF (cytidylyltransferase family)